MSGSAVPAYFEETHVRQILQAVDIVGLISSYLSLKPQGKDFVGLCPFHDDHRPSMHVSPSKQIFKCFSCGAGGNIFQFMMLRERLTFPEAVKLLAEKAGIQLPQRQQPTAKGLDRTDLEKVNRWAADFFRQLLINPVTGKRARNYVKQRGINDEYSEFFQLGWAPDSWDSLLNAAKADNIPLDQLSHLGLLVQRETGGFYDRFRERLIFPVRDNLGRFIAFGGRTLGDDPAKYLNSPESSLFDKSRALYGIFAAKDAIHKQKCVIVVEGYTDCIMAHQMGISNVVATLGTALTEEHARILSRYTDKIILMFDGDTAGRKAADRATEIFFKQRMEVSIATLSDNRDPCDFLLQEGPESFLKEMEAASDALEFKWRQMLDNLQAQDGIKGRARAIELFLELIADATLSGHMDQISQGFLLNRVSKLVERPVNSVHQTVARMQARKKTPAKQEHAISSPRTISFDGLTNAWQEIIEVLLNEPERFEQIAQAITELPELADPELNQILRLVRHSCSVNHARNLSEILAGCESPLLCARITDLADRGGKRGNFDQTLDGALAYIQRSQEKQNRQDIRQLVSANAQDLGPEAQTAMLQELQMRLQTNHRINLN